MRKEMTQHDAKLDALFAKMLGKKKPAAKAASKPGPDEATASGPGVSTTIEPGSSPQVQKSDGAQTKTQNTSEQLEMGGSSLLEIDEHDCAGFSPPPRKLPVTRRPPD